MKWTYKCVLTLLQTLSEAVKEAAMATYDKAYVYFLFINLFVVLYCF